MKFSRDPPDVEGNCECNWISSCGQPIKGGPPVWGLGDGLTTLHRKRPACYEMLHRTSEFAGSCEHDNKP